MPCVLATKVATPTIARTPMRTQKWFLWMAIKKLDFTPSDCSCRVPKFCTTTCERIILFDCDYFSDDLIAGMNVWMSFLSGRNWWRSLRQQESTRNLYPEELKSTRILNLTLQGSESWILLEISQMGILKLYSRFMHQGILENATLRCIFLKVGFHPFFLKIRALHDESASTLECDNKNSLPDCSLFFEVKAASSNRP